MVIFLVVIFHESGVASDKTVRCFSVIKKNDGRVLKNVMLSKTLYQQDKMLFDLNHVGIKFAIDIDNVSKANKFLYACVSDVESRSTKSPCKILKKMEFSKYKKTYEFYAGRVKAAANIKVNYFGFFCQEYYKDTNNPVDSIEDDMEIKRTVMPFSYSCMLSDFAGREQKRIPICKNKATNEKQKFTCKNGFLITKVNNSVKRNKKYKTLIWVNSEGQVEINVRHGQQDVYVSKGLFKFDSSYMGTYRKDFKVNGMDLSIKCNQEK